MYGISAIFGMFAIILMDSGIWKALSFALIILLAIAFGYKEFFKQKLLVNNEEENENSKIDGQIEIEEKNNI